MLKLSPPASWHYPKCLKGRARIKGLEEGSANSMCSVGVRDAAICLLALNTTLRATSLFICTGYGKSMREVRPDADWVEGRGCLPKPGLGHAEATAELWMPHSLSAGWGVDSFENRRARDQPEVPQPLGLSSQKSWVDSVKGI